MAHARVRHASGPNSRQLAVLEDVAAQPCRPELEPIYEVCEDTTVLVTGIGGDAWCVPSTSVPTAVVSTLAPFTRLARPHP